MTVAGVILAAGGSRRFAGGDHKLTASFRGRSLVAWSVAAAQEAGLDETVVVVGAVDLTPVLPEGLTVLANDEWRSGQAGSLRVALDWCARQGHAAAVVGLGDQPLIPASAWRAVAEAPPGPIVVATYGGRRRNPVRLERSVWAQMPAGGDEGARSLMRRQPELVTEVACEGEPADVDTVEDLRAWS
ncbi:MAG TPA: nucleotidyltransferase family protein [Acidimicrobiales bacterium]|nr:nucleotidyltransferase family protein [Acidimicrobiales bacterium]